MAETLVKDYITYLLASQAVKPISNLGNMTQMWLPL